MASCRQSAFVEPDSGWISGFRQQKAEIKVAALISAFVQSVTELTVSRARVSREDPLYKRVELDY